MPGVYDQDYINAINRAYAGSNLNISDLYEIYKDNTKEKANKIVDQMIAANKRSILKNNTPEEIRDVSLNVTDYKKLKNYKNKEAVARMIQHILITKKGTYPNNPTFGVGIEDYLFDLATGTMKMELENEINNQMSLWLTSEITKTNIQTKQEIQYLRSNDNNCITLAIFFTVYENNDKGNTDEYKINLFYTGNSTNRKVISEMDL